MKPSPIKIVMLGGSLALFNHRAVSAFAVLPMVVTTTRPRLVTPAAAPYSLLQQTHSRHYSFLVDLFSPPKIASTNEIQKLLSNKKSVLVDCRSKSEIAVDGRVSVQGHSWVHAPGTPFDCPLLMASASSVLPDKQAPVIIYCASGKRAGKAKEILERQGYTSVVNAGGADNLRASIS